MSALRFAEVRSEWLDAFNADPAEELDALLRGYTLVPPYQRANPSEVAVRLFSALGEDDPLMELLDRSLVEWIVARMAEPEDARLEVGINAYIQHVQEALTVAHRLPLPLTVALLHDRFSDLTGWAERLNLGSARDLRADYWHTLALVQTRRSFLSLWNRCCDEAGRDLPDNYLFIGLLGLQHLPRREGDPDLSHELLTGFARWASRLDDNDTAWHRFLREWRALALRYPRAPATLRSMVAPVLVVYMGHPFAKWWAEELDVEDSASYAPTRERMKNIEVEAVFSGVADFLDEHTFHTVRSFYKKAERGEDLFLGGHAWTSRFDAISKLVLQHEMTKRFLDNSVSTVALEDVSSRVFNLSEISALIAAVEEQAEAAHQIARNLDQAVTRTREVALKLSVFSSASSEANRLIVQSWGSAGALSSQPNLLQSQLEVFLSSIKAK